MHLIGKCGYFNNTFNCGVNYAYIVNYFTMKIAIITTCTNRKTKAPKNSLSGRNLPSGDQEDLLHDWVRKIRNEQETFYAKNLYCGRGFSEILKIKSNASARVWIISFGMGLVYDDMPIPPYQLTLTRTSEDSILNKVSSNFNPSEWWKGINQQLHGISDPISNIINNNKDTIFVISVSQAYLDLIISDLFSLQHQDLSRVRIVGPPQPIKLPYQYRHLWMPYDDRFDGPESPNPGTRSDFSQRIARHFIENVLIPYPMSSAEEQCKLVDNFMGTMNRAKQVKRRSLSDNEIANIITINWDLANGSSTRMLRVLRDKEKVACEQGRFATIFRKIRSER